MHISEKEQEPTLEEKRRMIEQKRDALRRTGFDLTLDAISLGAQKAIGSAEERERQRLIGELRGKAENSYLAAKEMDRLLSDLPEPVKEEGKE